MGTASLLFIRALTPLLPLKRLCHDEAGAPKLGDQPHTQHRDFAQGYRSRATLALPWPPCGINHIAIQVLNKHMLGVLLTSGEEPEAPRDLESSFCAPY